MSLDGGYATMLTTIEALRKRNEKLQRVFNTVLEEVTRMKERDWPEPADIHAMRHPDEAEIAALRRRNEKLERVAEAARETVLRRNEDSDGRQVKPTPWRDAAGKPFYIVDAKPADRLMDALSDLDKED